MVEKRPKPDWSREESEDEKSIRQAAEKKAKTKKQKPRDYTQPPKMTEEAIASAAESLKKIADRETSKDDGDPCNGPPPGWDSLTNAQRKVLAAFTVTGRMTEAIKATGFASPWIHINSMNKSKVYRRMYAICKRVAGEVLESEAIRRGQQGVRSYKFYKGDPIISPETGEPYYELNYSDRLLECLLKSFKPDEYKERKQVEHRKGDQPQQGESIADVLAKRAALVGLESQQGGNGQHHDGNGNGNGADDGDK